jgi:hypothetical protein
MPDTPPSDRSDARPLSKVFLGFGALVVVTSVAGLAADIASLISIDTDVLLVGAGAATLTIATCVAVQTQRSARWKAIGAGFVLIVAAAGASLALGTRQEPERTDSKSRVRGLPSLTAEITPSASADQQNATASATRRTTSSRQSSPPPARGIKDTDGWLPLRLQPPGFDLDTDPPSRPPTDTDPRVREVDVNFNGQSLEFTDSVAVAEWTGSTDVDRKTCENHARTMNMSESQRQIRAPRVDNAYCFATVQGNPGILVVTKPETGALVVNVRIWR